MLKIIILILRVILLVMAVIYVNTSVSKQDTPNTIYACTLLLILTLK